MYHSLSKRVKIHKHEEKNEFLMTQFAKKGINYYPHYIQQKAIKFIHFKKKKKTIKEIMNHKNPRMREKSIHLLHIYFRASFSGSASTSFAGPSLPRIGLSFSEILTEMVHYQNLRERKHKELELQSKKSAGDSRNHCEQAKCSVADIEKERRECRRSSGNK